MTTTKQLRQIAALAIRAPEEAANELLEHCCEIFGAFCGVLVQFEGGDAGPWARRVVHVDYELRQQSVFHSAEHFRCNPTSISGPFLADRDALAQIGPGWLDVFAGSCALIIPCIGRPLGFFDEHGGRVGAIILGVSNSLLVGWEALSDFIGVVGGLVLFGLDQANCAQVFYDNSFTNDVLRVETSLSAQQIGQNVLMILGNAVRFEAGVLYFLDEDPSANQYMVFGAAKNEGAQTLFQSYFPRSTLGITWRAARLLRPVAGGKDDVPGEARRSNDKAWSHVRDVHGAWALVPLVSSGRPVGVAHLEGVNNSRGVERWQYELLERLSLLIGDAVGKWQRRKVLAPDLQPSVALVERLYAIVDEGKRDPRAFQRFVQEVVRSISNVTLIPIDRRNTAAPDIFFSVEPEGIRCAVEVKCFARDKSVGEEALRQLVAQMEGNGAEVGLLILANTFASRNAASIVGKRCVIVFDLQRLQRFVSLSAQTRSLLFKDLLVGCASGLHMADLREVTVCE